MDAATAHRPTIDLGDGLPDGVPAGGRLEVVLRISCPEGCDLRGATVRIEGEDGHARTTSLEGPPEGGSGAAASIPVEVPPRVGAASWEVTFPEQEIAGSLHRGCRTSVETTVVPHRTSLAVWGVPSPVRGTPFTLRVGVKCSEGCGLAGQLVEVLGPEGVALGGGRLGEAFREGTEALYEGAVDVVAPDRTDVISCSALFGPSDLDLPHESAEADFTFRCLDRPEHMVSVRVVPEGVERAPSGVDVRLGAYRAETDSEGVASLGVPAGTYELIVWAQEIEPVKRAIEVSRDTRLDVVVRPRRVVDADEARMWM